MPPSSINLGLVKAIFSSLTAPTNTSVIWDDLNITSGLRHKYYDSTSLTWELITGAATPDATSSTKGKMKLYTDFTGNNTDGTVTQAAIKTEIASKVSGLLDLRGSYDASTDLFPTTGGSGTAGAVLKGDYWVVSVGGILGGETVVATQAFFANIDTPGQTLANWSILPVGSSTTPTLQMVSDAGGLTNTTNIIEGPLGGIALLCAINLKLEWFQGALYSLDNSDLIEKVQYKTIAPTVDDDETLFFKIGSYWEMNDSTLYKCTDATDGSAVWVLQDIFTKDTNNNIFYNGFNPTLGTGCSKNIFYRTEGTITLGNDAISNIFEPTGNTTNFIFGNNLRNVTVKAGNYPSHPTAGTLNLTAGGYSFLYNKDYPSEIFVGADGAAIHSYYDSANNRYTLTNLVSLLSINIGVGGGGSWGSITGILSSQTDLQSALNNKNDSKFTFRTLVANHTLDNTDLTSINAGQKLFLCMNVGSNNTVTIPLNATTAFPIGTEINITQESAFQTSIVATGGVTIQSAGGWLKLAAQFSAVTLIKKGTNTWQLIGQLAP